MRWPWGGGILKSFPVRCPLFVQNYFIIEPNLITQLCLGMTDHFPGDPLPQQKCNFVVGMHEWVTGLPTKLLMGLGVWAEGGTASDHTTVSSPLQACLGVRAHTRREHVSGKDTPGSLARTRARGTTGRQVWKRSCYLAQRGPLSKGCLHALCSNHTQPLALRWTRGGFCLSPATCSPLFSPSLRLASGLPAV